MQVVRNQTRFYFPQKKEKFFFSDVLENAFTSLSDEDYEVAMKHVRELLDLDPDQETSKYDGKMEVMWAVVSAFNK